MASKIFVMPGVPLGQHKDDPFLMQLFKYKVAILLGQNNLSIGPFFHEEFHCDQSEAFTTHEGVVLCQGAHQEDL